MALSPLDSMKDILDLFECHVCMEFMYPPIYQCPNGHTLCSKCKQGTRNLCPTCRGEMGDIRSLVLEKMTAYLSFPCKYNDKGCNGMFKCNVKQSHEEECRYRPYSCPYPCSPACMVTGDVETLVAHLRSDHGSEFNGGHVMDTSFTHIDPYNDQNTPVNVAIYNCHSEYFCLHFEAFHSPVDIVYMAFLTFMGDEIDAMDYRYDLEIWNDTHRMIWMGVPRSIREGIPQIRESYDGLVIHRSVAQIFAEVNSLEMLKLRVRGIIHKA